LGASRISAPEAAALIVRKRVSPPDRDEGEAHRDGTDNLIVHEDVRLHPAA
jgi:hypothetical protein